MRQEKLTARDAELIDLASSTTYRDSIERFITEAETDTARAILTEMLNNCETEWEEPSRRW